LKIFGSGGTLMDSKDTSRRHFLKNAALGGASLAVTGMAAKKVVDIVSESTVKKGDKPYLTHGDRVLMEREYVEMTESEKAEQVKMFVNNYKYESA
jgi:hypothetical protein